MHFAGLKPVGESVGNRLEYRDGGVYAPQLLTATRRADVDNLILLGTWK